MAWDQQLETCDWCKYRVQTVSINANAKSIGPAEVKGTAPSLCPQCGGPMQFKKASMVIFGHPLAIQNIKGCVIYRRQIRVQLGVKKVSVATGKPLLVTLVTYLLTTCNPHFWLKKAAVSHYKKSTYKRKFGFEVRHSIQLSYGRKSS